MSALGPWTHSKVALAKAVLELTRGVSTIALVNYTHINSPIARSFVEALGYRVLLGKEHCVHVLCGAYAYAPYETFNMYDTGLAMLVTPDHL